MSSQIINMTGNFQKRIEELIHILKENILEEKIRVKLVIENRRYFDDCKVALLVFQKYYFRTKSYISLTILLTETEEEQTADIVGSGDRALWWSASLHFAKSASAILAANGFKA